MRLPYIYYGIISRHEFGGQYAGQYAGGSGVLNKHLRLPSLPALRHDFPLGPPLQKPGELPGAGGTDAGAAHAADASGGVGLARVVRRDGACGAFPGADAAVIAAGAGLRVHGDGPVSYTHLEIESA